MKLFLTVSLAVFLGCYGSIALYGKPERDRIAAEKTEQEARARWAATVQRIEDAIEGKWRPSD